MILRGQVEYEKLNARQKEIYNFQKVSAIFADYGFTTIGLSDDWMGADFLAIKFDGSIHLKVQLKGRLTFDKKYIGKDIYICFFDKDRSKWILYPHDELLSSFEEEIKNTKSWKEKGSYHFPYVSNKNIRKVIEYII